MLKFPKVVEPDEVPRPRKMTMEEYVAFCEMCVEGRLKSGKPLVHLDKGTSRPFTLKGK